MNEKLKWWNNIHSMIRSRKAIDYFNCNSEKLTNDQIASIYEYSHDPAKNNKFFLKPYKQLNHNSSKFN